MPTLLDTVKQVSSNFSVAEAFQILKPMSFFILGVIIYSFFIFKFYRYVARREVFQLKKHENARKSISVISYIIKHIFVLPVIIFFWFIILTIILAFLSKQEDIQTLLLVSIALVGAIRAMSYYTEDLSKDLAKMLPFALLGVFLVDISYFSFSNSLNTILQIPSAWKILVYYLLFIILLEFVLRLIYSAVKPFRKPEKETVEGE